MLRTAIVFCAVLYCIEGSCNETLCLNGGYCSDVLTNCTCPEEWTGSACDTALCESTFCLNGGRCLFPNLNCTCPDEWEGDRCEEALCDDGFCLNGGTCLYPDVNCTCPDQWSGNRCQNATCDDDFCSNGGNCSYYPNRHCLCVEGWEGPQCQTAICDNWFCLNGGNCLFPNTNCSCLQGWTGHRCSVRVSFNHTMILYICIGATFLIYLLITILLIGIVQDLRKGRKNKYSISNRDKEEMWMEANNTRYNLIEVTRPDLASRNDRTNTRETNRADKSTTTVLMRCSNTAIGGKSVPSSSEEQLENVKICSPGIASKVASDSQEEAPVQSRRQHASNSEQSNSSDRLSRIKYSVHSQLSNELLAEKIKNRRSYGNGMQISNRTKTEASTEGMHTAKKPLIPPQVDKIAAKESLGGQESSRCTSLQSEVYYSVPDHTPTTASSDDSRLTFQKATTSASDPLNKLGKPLLPATISTRSGTTAPDQQNKPNKSPLAPVPVKSGTIAPSPDKQNKSGKPLLLVRIPIKSEANAAYGVLDAQKKALNGSEKFKGDSSDEELQIYKV